MSKHIVGADIEHMPLIEVQKLAEKLAENIPRRMHVEKAPKSLLNYARVIDPGYQDPPHIRLLAETLEKVERGEIRRLIINMPPRHGKTRLASEIFPGWYLGKHPERFIISATYAQDLALDYGRKVRNQFLDDGFCEVFETVELARDSQSAIRFSTARGGVYFAVGVGGPITGRGAHLLIIDDPIKGREEADSPVQRQAVINWYRSVARTRLMPGASAIIIINTRWHEEDLAGWVMKENAHEGWHLLSLPALAEPTLEKPDPLGRKENDPLWPEAFDYNELVATKLSVGPREWNALYQQRPSDAEGNIFKRENWQVWRHKTAKGECDPPDVEYVLMSFDTAFSEKTTADYTAITTWGVFTTADGQKNAILLNAINRRMEWPELRSLAMQLYKNYNPDTILIEAKASGQSLIQDLRRAGVPVVSFNPERDKVSRANSVVVLFEQKRVWVPADKDWAEMLIDQMARFPNARHDDLVDSAVMALMRLKSGYLLTLNEDIEEEPEYTRRRRRGYW